MENDILLPAQPNGRIACANQIGSLTCPKHPKLIKQIIIYAER